jgi:tRNA threonylcarbamoyl adenosine modification protein (Sua5/YciO/YrdC/YwlC family)
MPCAIRDRYVDTSQGTYPAAVARFLDVHPKDPQPRAIAQLAAMLRDDAVIAYPTDSCYALGCALGSRTGVQRIRRIRNLPDTQPLTVVCADMAQLGQLVRMDTVAFRAIRAATPGPYTFVLPASRELPKLLADPKRRTVGVRIPDHPVVRALLHELGDPLVSSTLLLPGDVEPLTDGWQVNERIGHLVDAVVDAGECGVAPSTVVDWTAGYPEVVRVGAGDPAPFE